MNIAAKEGQRKAEHPKRFCSAPKCLWRVMDLNHETQEYVPNPKYVGGRCPRHGGGK